MASVVLIDAIVIENTKNTAIEIKVEKWTETWSIFVIIKKFLCRSRWRPTVVKQASIGEI